MGHLIDDHRLPLFKPNENNIALPITIPTKLGDLEKQKHSESILPVGCSVYDICVIQFPGKVLTFELVYRPLSFFIILRSNLSFDAKLQLLIHPLTLYGLENNLVENLVETRLVRVQRFDL